MAEYIAGNCAPQGKRLSEKPLIHPSCRISDSTLGAWTELYANCELQETVFGDYSYAAGDVTIIYAEIGKFCSFASHVRINPGNHPMQRVTQHHCTYRRRQFGFADTDDAEFFSWRRRQKCIISHDVWIGHGAVVMPGVKIGTGAVIGAGAIVTKDVAPYDIVAGVPARRIGQRFSSTVAEKLLAIAWWNWDRPTLEQRFGDLLDTDQFVEKYFKPGCDSSI